MVWSQDTESCGSPSSKWCLLLRSSAKSLDISKAQLALERQLDQSIWKLWFPSPHRCGCGMVLSSSGALALGGLAACLEKMTCSSGSWLLLAQIPVSLSPREVRGATSLPKQQPADCPSYMAVAAFKMLFCLLKYSFNLKEYESK